MTDYTGWIIMIVGIPISVYLWWKLFENRDKKRAEKAKQAVTEPPKVS